MAAWCQAWRKIDGWISDYSKAIARLPELDPAMRVSNVKIRAPLRRPEYLAKVEEGLRIAGLPEA